MFWSFVHSLSVSVSTAPARQPSGSPAVLCALGVNRTFQKKTQNTKTQRKIRKDHKHKKSELTDQGAAVCSKWSSLKRFQLAVAPGTIPPANTWGLAQVTNGINLHTLEVQRCCHKHSTLGKISARLPLASLFLSAFTKITNISPLCLSSKSSFSYREVERCRRSNASVWNRQRWSSFELYGFVRFVLLNMGPCFCPCRSHHSHQLLVLHHKLPCHLHSSCHLHSHRHLHILRSRSLLHSHRSHHNHLHHSHLHRSHNHLHLHSHWSPCQNHHILQSYLQNLS